MPCAMLGMSPPAEVGASSSSSSTVLLASSSFQIHNMKVLNFMLVLILFLALVHVQPNVAGRVLNMKEQLVSLDKDSVIPSGPSTCTYIPRTGGRNCPPLEEMNIARKVQHPSGQTYPRLVVPFGVPNQAGRVMKHMSIDKSSVIPSGPSTCTYIPGTGGRNCPPVEEMNVAGKLQSHTVQTFPRLIFHFGLASNQHY
ncbi:hypothetical protein VNO78_20055 [Psophocarpus tetragonolobus]|uniref:Uncharacterized protein n=1 Tax=Psophocarpus tetragonolobus TaxID=3891 RepID=A0AAN9SCN9_PSOTE